MMNRFFTKTMLALISVLMLASAAFAAKAPEITFLRATRTSNQAGLQIKWKSSAPVVAIETISSGSDEIQRHDVDPRIGNKKRMGSYTGETTVLVKFDQYSEERMHTVLVQAIDMHGRRSRQKTASVENPYMTSNATKVDDSRLKQHVEGSPAAPLGIVEQARETDARFDSPPYFQSIRIRTYKGNNISFAMRAGDNNGLNGITLRILDDHGKEVARQEVSATGKGFVGDSKTFELPEGRYKLLALARDNANNLSTEKELDFVIGNPPPPEGGTPGHDQPNISLSPATVTPAEGDKRTTFTVKTTASSAQFDATTVSFVVLDASNKNVVSGIKPIVNGTSISAAISGLAAGEYRAFFKAGGAASQDARIVVKGITFGPTVVAPGSGYEGTPFTLSCVPSSTDFNIRDVKVIVKDFHGNPIGKTVTPKMTGTIITAVVDGLTRGSYSASFQLGQNSSKPQSFSVVQKVVDPVYLTLGRPEVDPPSGTADKIFTISCTTSKTDIDLNTVQLVLKDAQGNDKGAGARISISGEKLVATVGGLAPGTYTVMFNVRMLSSEATTFEVLPSATPLSLGPTQVDPKEGLAATSFFLTSELSTKNITGDIVVSVLDKSGKPIAQKIQGRVEGSGLVASVTGLQPGGYSAFFTVGSVKSQPVSFTVKEEAIPLAISNVQITPNVGTPNTVFQLSATCNTDKFPAADAKLNIFKDGKPVAASSSLNVDGTKLSGKVGALEPGSYTATFSVGAVKSASVSFKVELPAPVMQFRGMSVTPPEGTPEETFVLQTQSTAEIPAGDVALVLRKDGQTFSAKPAIEVKGTTISARIANLAPGDYEAWFTYKDIKSPAGTFLVFEHNIPEPPVTVSFVSVQVNPKQGDPGNLFTVRAIANTDKYDSTKIGFAMTRDGKPEPVDFPVDMQANDLSVRMNGLTPGKYVGWFTYGAVKSQTVTFDVAKPQAQFHFIGIQYRRGKTGTTITHELRTKASSPDMESSRLNLHLTRNGQNYNPGTRIEIQNGTDIVLNMRNIPAGNYKGYYSYNDINSDVAEFTVHDETPFQFSRLQVVRTSDIEKTPTTILATVNRTDYNNEGLTFHLDKDGQKYPVSAPIQRAGNSISILLNDLPFGNYAARFEFEGVRSDEIAFGFKRAYQTPAFRWKGITVSPSQAKSGTMFQLSALYEPANYNQLDPKKFTLWIKPPNGSFRDDHAITPAVSNGKAQYSKQMVTGPGVYEWYMTYDGARIAPTQKFEVLPGDVLAKNVRVDPERGKPGTRFTIYADYIPASAAISGRDITVGIRHQDDKQLNFNMGGSASVANGKISYPVVAITKPGTYYYQLRLKGQEFGYGSFRVEATGIPHLWRGNILNPKTGTADTTFEMGVNFEKRGSMAPSEFRLWIKPPNSNSYRDDHGIQPTLTGSTAVFRKKMLSGPGQYTFYITYQGALVGGYNTFTVTDGSSGTAPVKFVSIDESPRQGDQNTTFRILLGFTPDRAAIDMKNLTFILKTPNGVHQPQYIQPAVEPGRLVYSYRPTKGAGLYQYYFHYQGRQITSERSFEVKAGGSSSATPLWRGSFSSTRRLSPTQVLYIVGVNYAGVTNIPGSDFELWLKKPTDSQHRKAPFPVHAESNRAYYEMSSLYDVGTYNYYMTYKGRKLETTAGGFVLNEPPIYGKGFLVSPREGAPNAVFQFSQSYEPNDFPIDLSKLKLGIRRDHNAVEWTSQIRPSVSRGSLSFSRRFTEPGSYYVNLRYMDKLLGQATFIVKDTPFRFTQTVFRNFDELPSVNSVYMEAQFSRLLREGEQIRAHLIGPNGEKREYVLSPVKLNGRTVVGGRTSKGSMAKGRWQLYFTMGNVKSDTKSLIVE